MTFHFEGSQMRTRSASDLITLAGFEVYGQAPASAIDQLRREAAAADAAFQLFDEIQWVASSARHANLEVDTDPGS